VGSNPSAATTNFTHPHAVDESHPPNFNSLLKQIEHLSQEERNALFSIALSGKASILNSPVEGIEEWKNHMIAQGLAEGTITLYTRTIEMFLERYQMSTPRDVRNYSVQRLQKVTPTKVRNDQKALRSFFNFLEGEGLWLNNPTKGMQLLKVKRVIRQAPEKEHVDKLLTAWQGSETAIDKQMP